MRTFLITLSLLLLQSTESRSQDYWDSFCQSAFKFSTGQRVGTNSPDSDQRAQTALVNAWIMYEQGKPSDLILDSLDYMSKQILFKNKKDEKAQAIMNEQCFNSKYRELLDSLRKDISASNRFIREKKTKLAQKIFELTTSLPSYLKHKTPCTDISLSVTPDQSLVVIIKVKDCRADAEIDDKGYQRGQLGYPDIYQSIIDWYEQDVLLPLGKTALDEKDNTVVELKGKADGNPVNSDLNLGQNIIISKGKQYSVLDEFDIPSNAVLDIDIDSHIPYSEKSNEHLALARACLAEPFFQKIGSKISIVAKEYSSTGENYRGVEIKITAKKLLEDYAAAELAKERLRAAKNSGKIEQHQKNIDNATKKR